MAEDYERAGLDERVLAMLRYADKLTERPGDMTSDDVESLRRVGFDDTSVLAIAEVTGYYAYANRVVEGLGVTLEEEPPQR